MRGRQEPSLKYVPWIFPLTKHSILHLGSEFALPTQASIFRHESLTTTTTASHDRPGHDRQQPTMSDEEFEDEGGPSIGVSRRSSPPAAAATLRCGCLCCRHSSSSAQLHCMEFRARPTHHPPPWGCRGIQSRRALRCLAVPVDNVGGGAGRVGTELLPLHKETSRLL